MGSLGLNDFASVVGADPFTLQLNYIVTYGIVKGQSYAFRYRAINAIGAGPWSDISQLIAAQEPLAPPKPYYVSSTNTTIPLGFNQTIDNGGSIISGYILQRDAGNLTSSVNIIETNYNGIDSTYTV